MAERPAIGWSSEWTATGRRARINALELEFTRPCGTCWEQGRVWRQAGNGEGLVPTTCPECDGRRRVAREVSR